MTVSLLVFVFVCFNVTTFFFQNLNHEIFVILVLMALFTAFITTPIVMAIYKPARGNSMKTRQKLSGSWVTVLGGSGMKWLRSSESWPVSMGQAISLLS